MRKDEKIYRHVEEQRRAERETGCCIRNDDSGCVQSSHTECSVSCITKVDDWDTGCKESYQVLRSNGF